MNNRSIYKNIGYTILILFVLGIIVGFILWTQQAKMLEANLGLVEGTEQKKYLDNFVFVLAIYSISEVVLGLLSIMMFVFARANRVEQRQDSMDTIPQTETVTKQEITSEESGYTNVVEKVIMALQDIIGKQEYNNENLLEKLLWQICKELEMAQGLVYIMQEKEKYKKLSAVASYALYLPEGRKMEYKIGEGLVGQVAKNEELILISQVPENYIRVSSGLGESSPQNLVLIPIKSEDADILGILELASFRQISVKDKEILEEVALLLAREIEKSEFIDIDTN